MARKSYWLAAQGSIDLTCNYWKSDKTENEKKERTTERGRRQGGSES
jgi:hypothetical protein